MSDSILGQVTLGYEPLWGRARQLCGVRLLAQACNGHGVDAPHLVSTLAGLWGEQAPLLLLCAQSPALLRDLLAHAPAHAIGIEVRQQWLDEPAMAQSVHQAHQRGLSLVWRGEPGQRPGAPLAPCFGRLTISLTPEEALTALRVSLRKHHGQSAPAQHPLKSPVAANQICDSVASRVLAEHCLDQQGAWAVADWPLEDVLHGYRLQRLQPARSCILRLLEAIDHDDALDAIEHLLGREPLLTYRFLRYANSAALGLSTPVQSLRHGLMILGYAMLRAWLVEQLPHASCDMNLDPVRLSLVLRAELMTRLLDPGESEELRAEVYLCGLLSQIDLLLGEPLSESLQRIPVAERVRAALLDNSGPYAAFLELASALHSDQLTLVQSMAERHGQDAEHVNRTLLRVLAAARQTTGRAVPVV